MISKENLTLEINKLKPFPFKVGENYYVIGLAAFRKCTAGEIELVREYEMEWDKLTCSGICIDISSINPKKTTKLADITKRILRASYSEYSDNAKKLAQKETCSLLHDASDQTIRALYDQIKKMRRATELADLVNLQTAKKIR